MRLTKYTKINNSKMVRIIKHEHRGGLRSANLKLFGITVISVTVIVT